MKVTTEGEKVIDDLWDVIAAKGFEKDTYFEMAARDIRGLPKLEGTVHVNMALVLKFMANYLFNPAEYPPVPPRRDAADDEFLFRQGPARGLGKIRFHDWRAAYDAVRRRPERRPLHRAGRGPRRRCSRTAPPSEEQQRDLDFLLTLGELFTLVVYGQLILEQAALTGLDGDTIDAIFDVLVRDFSALRRRPARTRRRPPRPSRPGRSTHVRKPVGDARPLRARLGPGGAARGRLRDAALGTRGSGKEEVGTSLPKPAGWAEPILGSRGMAAAPHGRQSTAMLSVSYRLTFFGGTVKFLLARNPKEAFETGEHLWGNVQFVQIAR